MRPRVMVIGGGGGIGQAVVRQFVSRGARVAAVDLDFEAVKHLCEQLRNDAGAEVSAVRADVTSYDDVVRATDQATEALGGLDVVVNCVGWNHHSLFVDQTPDFWRRVISINLEGQMYAAHAAIPHLVRAGGGSIVLLASDAGRVGTKGEAAYSAAKGGVIALTKSLARELVKDNIRVNCVSPGPTDTPMLQSAIAAQPEVLQRMTRLIPMRRVASPDEQARAIVFLASPEASYITGQVLSVNGGLNMV